MGFNLGLGLLDVKLKRAEKIQEMNWVNLLQSMTPAPPPLLSANALL